MTTEKITITITEEDILNGRINDCMKCPLALALNRAVAPIRAEVFSETAEVWWGGALHGSTTYTLPTDARDFIWHFDTGLPVDEGTFTLVCADD